MKRFFLFFFLFIASGLVISALMVDRRVQKQLQRKNQHWSGILSAPLQIHSQRNLQEDRLLKIFQRRGYQHVTGSPKESGQYSKTDSFLELISLPFPDPRGFQKPEEHVLFDIHTNEIRNVNRPEATTFRLEPEHLRKFGVASKRSEEFRPLSEFPRHLLEAVVAIEDRRFQDHFGVDLVGISRAMLTNIKKGRIAQGGSTITQQLVKNLLFSPERTIRRKFLEALAALSLEWHLSKAEILEMYLNEVYLGQEGSAGIHGFPRAARVFFGKDIRDVSLSESALLAGLIRAPSYYSPVRHYGRSIKRRNLVLKKLLSLELIGKKQYQKAFSNEPLIKKNRLQRQLAPHFLRALREDLQLTVHSEALEISGATVFTGIHPGMQYCAREAIQSSLPELESRLKTPKKNTPLEAALVSIEPYSGIVRSWVGSHKYAENQFDHVRQARRQIGSTIKPFLYLSALQGDSLKEPFTPITVLPDQPIAIETARARWTPQNYDRDFREKVTLRYALERSLNIPTVFLSNTIGLQNFTNTLRNFRLGDKIPEVPALALGTLETSLLDLTAAYAALANSGRYITPRLFLSVLDSNGSIITTSKIQEEQIAHEGAVYILTNILQGAVERGTGKIIRQMGYQGVAAGKTGTTDGKRDAWFVGFSPDLVTGVWVGYDDNTPHGFSGASGAAPIWARYMSCVDPFIQGSRFIPPRGVSFVDIDIRNGNAAESDTPEEYVVKEVFLNEALPAGSRSLSENNQGEILQQQKNEEQPRRRKSLWEVLFGT